jgi:hypothetical protein
VEQPVLFWEPWMMWLTLMKVEQMMMKLVKMVFEHLWTMVVDLKLLVEEVDVVGKQDNVVEFVAVAVVEVVVVDSLLLP